MQNVGSTILLEYRNTECRLHHIHEHDVTSSLKENGEKGPLDLFSSGFFLLEQDIKNSEGQCKTTVRSGARRPSTITLVLGSVYLICSGSAMFTGFDQATISKANAYSANIEFNVSAHGGHNRERKAPTENSNTLFYLALSSHPPTPLRQTLHGPRFCLARP